MTGRPDRPRRPAVPANLRARLAQLEAITKRTESTGTGARERLAERIARLVAAAEDDPHGWAAERLQLVVERLERTAKEKAP